MNMNDNKEHFKALKNLLIILISVGLLFAVTGIVIAIILSFIDKSKFIVLGLLIYSLLIFAIDIISVVVVLKKCLSKKEKCNSYNEALEKLLNQTMNKKKEEKDK